MAPRDGQTKDVAARRLLLLIPTTSYRVADFMAAAKRLDVEVVVGSDQALVLARFSEGGSVTLDFADLGRGAAQISKASGNRGFAAIVGVEERTTILAAKAAAALGLPHNDPEAALAAADKHRQRRCLAAAGLPVPAFRLIEGRANWPAAAAAIPYPAVLKPLSLSASRGVIRIDGPDDFAPAAERILQILERTDAPILAETYLPGREVALEGLLVGGALTVLALFDKPDPLEGPFFEETLYVTPSRLPEATQALVAETTEAAALALGLREGPVHAELRLNDADSGDAGSVDGGAWIIELAARTIGGHCGRSLRFGGGLTLEDIVLRHALGLPLDDLAREPMPSGVMMIPIPQAGRLVAVTGRAAAEAVPGITDVTISIAPGQDLVPLPEGDRYLGFIFAKGETPQAVEAALREAHGALAFEIA